jgi:hypothetical protein
MLRDAAAPEERPLSLAFGEATDLHPVIPPVGDTLTVIAASIAASFTCETQ